MRAYFGPLAQQLLLELGVEGMAARVLLLGGNALVTEPIRDFLSRAGMEVRWFAAADGARPYEELSADGAGRPPRRP